jgi:hypothetical protein
MKQTKQTWLETFEEVDKLLVAEVSEYDDKHPGGQGTNIARAKVGELLAEVAAEDVNISRVTSAAQRRAAVLRAQKKWRGIGELSVLEILYAIGKEFMLLEEEEKVVITEDGMRSLKAPKW